MNRIVVWVIAAGVLCVGLPMAASATEDCPQLVTDTSSSVLDESWFVQYTVGSRPGQGTKTTGHQWFSLNPDPESSTCGERGGWGNDPETTVPVTITAVSRATALQHLMSRELELENQEGFSCDITEWSGELSLACNDINTWSDYPEEGCDGRFHRWVSIRYEPLEIVGTGPGSTRGPAYYLARESSSEYFRQDCPCQYCIEPTPA